MGGFKGKLDPRELFSAIDIINDTKISSRDQVLDYKVSGNR